MYFIKTFKIKNIIPSLFRKSYKKISNNNNDICNNKKKIGRNNFLLIMKNVCYVFNVFSRLITILYEHFEIPTISSTVKLNLKIIDYSNK